jgi:steroid delta-isomerase-like uncharacterized protein
MSAEYEALVRRWFDEVWNQGKSETIDELLAADALAHGLGDDGVALRGPEGFKALHTAFLSAIPDLHITVDEVVCAGDLTAAHITCRGTHTGDGLGFPATGKPVVFTGMTLTRFRDGKIVEGWNAINFLSMLQQMGKVPDRMSAL